ncbi:MAG TPA: hypothetical protein DG761_11140 [Gammaproteobacteria bacterium]|jgi:hypothetical protein|nr:hypothetical protein [Arenicellales bacterium]MDP7064429.1 hypothetical protein [Arenicellales bacterium]HCX88568.1 hypothetical protein [Gammaproteobacteria bacterium]|tara:strand:- start:243 stop:431 length:189 start_codon:yes stop_codon:yes gene_type:complete
MTCENDNGSSPEMAYAISSEIAGSQTVITLDLQHMGLSERPSVFISEILRFLAAAASPDGVL